MTALALETKVCTSCGVEKDIADFALRGDGSHNRRSHCRDCRSEYQRGLRTNGPQKKELRTDGLKGCTRCGVEQELSAFYTDSRKVGGGVAAECKSCVAERGMLRLYGISWEQYHEMEARQGGACALCGRDDAQLHVDHDHVNGRVRGLLCRTCNQGLGKLGDNEEGIYRALLYVRGEL